jgi:hypothetical protein
LAMRKNGLCLLALRDADVWSCKMDTGSQVGEWDVQEVR